MSAQKLAFGPFVLDTGASALTRQGAPVPVSYRGLLLLAAFLERPGENLSKSELDGGRLARARGRGEQPLGANRLAA